MKKVRLTESDLVNIIKRVVSEQKDKVTSQSRPLVNRPKMESQEMNEAPGCPPGMTYCASAKQCCPPGAECLGGCVGPNGRKVRGYNPDYNWGG
jgi:hypothetical protein